MKKSLFYTTIIALIIGISSFFQSCTPDHDNLNDGQTSYLNYEFSVADQINVQQYEVEISTTGDVNGTWNTGIIVMANTGGLNHTYLAKIDVTCWFKQVDIIYSRIKSVDLDGKVQYSTMSTTRNGS